MAGQVIHTGQVVIDLALRVDSMPSPGGDVFASAAGMFVGGGFNVLAAVRQMGVEACYAGAIGTGPFADAAITGLSEIGASHIGERMPGVDQGYCVALTDKNAERTFISTSGAETLSPENAFDDLLVSPRDVVYISGYSLVHDGNLQAIKKLLGRILKLAPHDRPTVLFDASPMIEMLDDELTSLLIEADTTWSVNEREALILANRWNIPSPSGNPRLDSEDWTGFCRALGEKLGSALVRSGETGAMLFQNGVVTSFPTIEVESVDSNGAGDAHTGVLAALIAEGVQLSEAIPMANIAGALSTTRIGPATCPSREEITLHLGR